MADLARARTRATRALLGLGILAATIGAGVTPAPPVAAAGARVWGEVLVDEIGGHVFATDFDGVDVYDREGRPVTTIGGLTDAVDLVLRGRTLYVLRGGEVARIDRVDADTLAVTGGWTLGAEHRGVAMAWAHGRLWFTHGTGELGAFDPARGTVTSVTLPDLHGKSDIAATETPPRVYAFARGPSPSPITAIDIGELTPTVLRTTSHAGSCSTGKEMAVSVDGTTAWTACSWYPPDVIPEWDLSTLAAPTSGLEAVWGTDAIARSTGGAFLVAGHNAQRSEVRLYDTGTAAPAETFSIDADVVPGMVAVAAGGSRIHLADRDGGLTTLRLDPVVEYVDPTTVPGDMISAQGHGLADVTEGRLGGRPVVVHPRVDDDWIDVDVPADMPAGLHTLVLGSRWGDSTDTPATVRVGGPAAPDTPDRPTATPVTGRSATVTWPAAAFGSAPATSYEVTVWVGADAVATRTVTGRSVTFTGLPPGSDPTYTVVAVNAVGRSRRSLPSAAHPPVEPDVSPFPSLAAFVARQHADLLGRPATAAERDEWVAHLRDGSRRPEDLIIALRATTDHTGRVDPVVRLYQAYFRRTPDAAGLRYWIGERRAGRTIYAMSQAFAASAEFRTLYGTLTDRAFVELVYRNVLGRPGDPAGVDYWAGELVARRSTRGKVMVGFSESVENRAAQRSEVTASVLSVLLLGRAPTATERARTVVGLDDGVPVATLVAEVLARDEYTARVSG